MNFKKQTLKAHVRYTTNWSCKVHHKLKYFVKCKISYNSSIVSKGIFVDVVTSCARTEHMLFKAIQALKEEQV